MTSAARSRRDADPELEIDADGIATITFDEPGSPVNTMNEQWQHDLAEAVTRLVRERGRDPRHRAGIGEDRRSSPGPTSRA